ncbi:MAG: hypothetical protein V3U92_06340 [Cellulophaga sp.]
MEDKNLEKLFEQLHGSFDNEEPKDGHKNRFFDKLNASNEVVTINSKKKNWWKPLSIAASIVLLCVIGFNQYASPSAEEQLAEISPEVSKTQFYFANLINEQVLELESNSTPETKKIIEDTLKQLKKLENNYASLEQDLLNGGNSKLVLSAMITNFQTRIDLLQDVLNQIENIKNLKNYDDENFTI